MIIANQITAVKELLLMDNLQIPPYQRPYKWTIKNVNQLIDDIISHKKKSSYRIGTLVLYKNNGRFDIVDGQQRTITLTLIAYAILKFKQDELKRINVKEDINNYYPKLLNAPFSNDVTKFNIQNNYREIVRRIREFDEQSILFFFSKCELVQVALSEISESFQFFDSQNSRGKDLEPHDLLKAFHLREMMQLTEDERKKSVSFWESLDTDKLSNLFGQRLFRIRNWSKGYSARDFTKNDIDVFKGIDPEKKYPFSKPVRWFQILLDNYNSRQRQISKSPVNYPFQIDQIIINGKRFFEMIDYYNKTVNGFENDLKSNKNIQSGNAIHKIYNTLSSYDGRNRIGDKYIRTLFDCALLYYFDRFGIDNISRAMEKIFVWAYSLRLELQSVYLASIDKYALDDNIFIKIRDSIRPTDFINLKLDIVKQNNSTKTGKIKELFVELGYFDVSK
ncbi:hypothetical protein AGMMS4952_13950 [Spirochaetia bacterium]|nr:hypothetical protein AGMMS4952_13950 [Spirochaetia bacterium]